MSTKKNKQQKQKQQQKKQEVKVNPLLFPKWKQRTYDTHKKHLGMYKGKSFKVAFLGDSMMEHWLKNNHWNKHFSEYANLGVGGDGIEHLLYRLKENEPGLPGILDVMSVEKIILMIGTNNSEKR